MSVVVVVVLVVVSRGRLMGRRVQRALLTLAVCFLLGSVVFRECWAGLSVLLGKLQGDDAMEQRRRRGGGGGGGGELP